MVSLLVFMEIGSVVSLQAYASTLTGPWTALGNAFSNLDFPACRAYLGRPSLQSVEQLPK